MNFRFRLQHDSGEVSITEPDGWKNSKIILDRHKEFYSLIERYEGSAGDAFIFYGANDLVDGGINFIKDVEQTYGFDANIEITVDYSEDDEIYDEVFRGLLDIPGKTETKDNKVKIPVIRDEFWAKFINRMDTPVDLSSTTDLDGNAVTPVTPVTINLTPQKLRQSYHGRHLGAGAGHLKTPFEMATNNHDFGLIDFENEVLSEIDEKNSLPVISAEFVTFSILFTSEYGGDYAFDTKITLVLSDDPGDSTDSVSAYYDVKLVIDDTEYPLTPADVLVTTFDDFCTPTGTRTFTIFSYTGDHELNEKSEIQLYVERNSTPFGNNERNPYLVGEETNFGNCGTSAEDYGIESYLKIDADTVFPESTGQGYLLHDAIHGTLVRYGLGSNPFYSEFLGAQFTNERVYGSNGCGSPYVLMKGLQIKGYTLAEKPFFTSFKHLWNGSDPILNLGLGYEIISSTPVVQIDQKDHWFDTGVSVNFSNVRDIEATYDKDHIFKTIKTGFKEWESGNFSGIDDPQTKHTYANRFIKTGVDIDLESEFIAASLAIESCRRSSKEKSRDYKHDNKTFIIALNDDDVSPDRYEPELDENFDSITGLLNSETRYNSILTPMRSLLRWANVLGGCLQMYTDSGYKFVSGEGNFDMVSDYSCGGGNQCQAILCDALAENADIPLGAPSNYNSTFGYLFYPMIYKISIPMAYQDFQTIKSNHKKPIGISQSETGHAPFYIKTLEYNITNGSASILAWPKTYFDIQTLNQTYTQEC